MFFTSMRPSSRVIRWLPAVALVVSACGSTPDPEDLGPADTTPVALEPGAPFPLRDRAHWPTHDWPTLAREAGPARRFPAIDG